MVTGICLIFIYSMDAMQSNIANDVCQNPEHAHIFKMVGKSRI